MADFGISRRLNVGQTTLVTRAAGTKCWKPSEAVEEESESGYKRSSDVQVSILCTTLGALAIALLFEIVNCMLVGLGKTIWRKLETISCNEDQNGKTAVYTNS